MSRDVTQVVYRDGTFHEEPAPAWLCDALNLADGGLRWHKALSQVLETEDCPFGAEALEGSAIEIILWRSKRLGVYVEIRDCVAYWDDIWVPRPTGGRSRPATFCHSLPAPRTWPPPMSSSESAMR